jgi:integrase
MPRKPKVEKQTITVVVNGTPVAVQLHPPSGDRSSWFAYWSGLVTSKSTGQSNLEDAILVAEHMVRNGGRRADLSATVLSDIEFEQIQRRHFGRKTDDKAKVRAEKSLISCLDAIAAFREITGISPVALATPDDCARFQVVALTLPKLWRKDPPEQRRPVSHYGEAARAGRQRSANPDELDGLERYSPNSVVKWSRTLQAAFERANRNALKRKCVRGVVDEKKLLTGNPWGQFTWVEGRKKPIRQFDSDELLAFLDHFETVWAGVSVVGTLAKVFLWSSGRRLETANLRWDDLRRVGGEYHFKMEGKWGVEKWFRVPDALYQELTSLRTASPYLFAAYPDQLRRFYEGRNEPGKARKVLAEFDPANLANWFYKKIVGWSRSLPKGHATTHIFRKTSLQYARSGEDINRAVANDARVGEAVMMTNYVEETDEEMRARSNRTFNRLAVALPPVVARRFGHTEVCPSDLERRLQSALATKDWSAVQELSAMLATGRPEAG